jgi:hypothetical protein
MRSRRWELGGEALAEMGAGSAALAEIKPAVEHRRRYSHGHLEESGVIERDKGKRGSVWGHSITWQSNDAGDVLVVSSRDAHRTAARPEAANARSSA